MNTDLLQRGKAIKLAVFDVDAVMTSSLMAAAVSVSRCACVRVTSGILRVLVALRRGCRSTPGAGPLRGTGPCRCRDAHRTYDQALSATAGQT